MNTIQYHKPILKTRAFDKTVKFRDAISKVTFPSNLAKVPSKQKDLIAYIISYGS